MSAALHPVEQYEVEQQEQQAAQPEFEYVVNGKHNIVFQLGLPGVMIAGFLNMGLAMMYGLGWQMEAWILGGLMWGTLLGAMGTLAWIAHASDNAA